jgi:hydrogenase nickel incorporation protein HypA/HybF
MHEFSLCDGILKQVARANQNNLANIDEIIIDIGKLANIDVRSLCFWFPVVAKNISCSQIKLTVNQIDGLALCNTCMCQFNLNNLYEPCPKCHEFGNYSIINGQELLVKLYKLI